MREKMRHAGSFVMGLRPAELLAAFAALSVVALEQGEVSQPRPAVIQRLAAVNGPLGKLPDAGIWTNRR